MSRITLAIALLGSMAIVPATAFALEPYLPKNPKAFSRADADANGKITSAELTPRAEKTFASVDADHDGRVTAAEIDADLKRAMERRRDRILASLDTDKDGAISKAELDAGVAKLVTSADADSDGGVSLEEARKYRVAKTLKPATGGTPN